MTKHDKEMGRVRPKHQPDKDPSTLVKQPSVKRKKVARYVTQRWSNSRFLRGRWWDVGASNQLEEAIRLTTKEDWMRRASQTVRVVDREEGKVVHWDGIYFKGVLEVQP